MNANQSIEMAPMTKREIVREIGDQATFVKKNRLERMALTKKQKYVLIGMRVYILALLVVISLSLLGII